MNRAPEIVALAPRRTSTRPPDIICLSHLRWDFVFQRPQHLMTRCARSHRVFFVEEPRPGDGAPCLDVHERHGGVRVLVPRIPRGAGDADTVQEELLRTFLADGSVNEYVLWYYTPAALTFTRALSPVATVYDCMDELSAFAGASPAIKGFERELLQRAELVLTGGRSLYESKRHLHPNIHPFPSSVDVEHFAKARTIDEDPEDQAAIPRPRLGFFGVVDERMDFDLLAGVAAARPDWHIVIVGPRAKIDEASLPRAGNIHYLGKKPYEQLPSYLAGWDVALLPFARNDATRLISPTKTPEYLAAGRPVVSTSIADVVRPYGDMGLARIGDTVSEFVAAAGDALVEDPVGRLRRADAFLSHTSWDGTWNRMYALLDRVIAGRDADRPAPTAAGSGEVA